MLVQGSEHETRVRFGHERCGFSGQAGARCRGALQIGLPGRVEQHGDSTVLADALRRRCGALLELDVFGRFRNLPQACDECFV